MLFDILADAEMKNRYGLFLHEVSTVPAADVHANMLWNKLGRLAQVISSNPLPYQERLRREFVVSSSAGPSRQGETGDVVRIERPGHGIKVVNYPDLPDQLRKKYDRIRELMPQKAKLHAELSATDGDEAADMANELCRIDDELRQLWDELDAWADGKQAVPKEENDVVNGMELMRREKKLRDNIRNNKNLVAKYEEQGNAEAAAKARERLAAYEKEMEELRKRIADEEAAS